MFNIVLSLRLNKNLRQGVRTALELNYVGNLSSCARFTRETLTIKIHMTTITQNSTRFRRT